MKPRNIFLCGFSAILLTVLLLRSVRPASSFSVEERESDTAKSEKPGRNKFQGFEHLHRIQKQIHRSFTDQVHDKLSSWKTESDRQARDRLMQELLSMLTDDNAAVIVRSLSSEDLAERFGIEALQHWLNSDPNGAAAWLSLQPGTTSEQADLVARRLLTLDGSLDQYLNRIPSSEWREKILNTAGFKIAATNPQQAIIYAEQMSPSESRTALLQSSAFELARLNPDAVIKWVSQIGDKELREQVTAWSAKGLAASDPARAAAWLVESVKDEKLLLESAQSIVRSWAADSPAQAAEWVVRFPNGPVQNEALETLITFWSSSDAIGVESWINSLPNGGFQENASTIFNRQHQFTVLLQSDISQ